MGAFNRRLQPKELFGVPLIVMIGIVGALACGLFTLMLPLVFTLVTGLGFLVCVALVAVGFWLGDDLPLRGVLWAAWRERGRVTSETWTDR
jgi:hypothetical protein